VNRSVANFVTAPPIPDFKNRSRNVQPLTGKSFDLTQAVPSYATFAKIKAELAKDLLEGRVDFYTEVPGLLELREKLCEKHPLLQKSDANRTLITAGANHAMMTALMCLLNAGDTVLLPEPFYFNYEMALPMLGLKGVFFQLDAHKGMQLNARDLVAFLETSARETKALVLITPNNPSGACYSPQEIHELLTWTSPRGIEVIVDETYLRFDPNHLAEPKLRSYLGKGLTLVGSFSKSFSLTGYRVGYLVLSPEQFTQALKIQDTMVICPSHIGQRAAIHGLEHCESDVQFQANRMAKLAQQLQTRLAALKHFQLVSQGAFFAYLKHPFSTMDAETAAITLYRETGILGLPGTTFGKSQQSFIRLSISNLDENQLKEAMDQLVDYDQRVKGARS